MDGFELISKLGEGAYSIVFKVKRKADSKIYALKKVKLKKLSEKEKQNALNEVRILASIKSTFVISYKEAFIDEIESSLCIVMEYADKGDLYQKIIHFKRMGYNFDELDVWKIFIQMTKGLKALHDLKILHRDLKSANIFLFSDGSAKIGDLNVSKVAKKGLGYTQTGTPYYASPEVWKDEPYDSKSDIWSLACVTYEMLTLHPPFRAESMKGLYEKVIKGKYPKISEKYSSDISELLKLLFKLNPKDRPSCNEILRNPIVVKRMEFLKSGADNDLDIANMDEAALLRTIRIPKNIIFLSNKLPKANYESGSDPNISTAENTKDVKNNYSNGNIVLPTLNNKVNYRYASSESLDENNNTNEIKKKNLNVITENNCNNNNNNNKIGLLHENSKGVIKSPSRNISPSSLNKIPNSEIRVSNQIRRQKKALAPINNKQKNVILNKGLSALYKLYISNDYRNSPLKNGNKIGLYLPNVYRRNANGIRSNSNSYLSPNVINSKKVASKKRLSPLNIKIQ